MSEQQILIGYTDAMTDKQVSELAEWADYQAKQVGNPRWKRGYALIREGADLILRRRAGADNDPSDFGENPQFGKKMQKKGPKPPECEECFDETGSTMCLKIAHRMQKKPATRKYAIQEQEDFL